MINLTIKRHQLIPANWEFKSRNEKYRFWCFVLGLSFPGYHIGINTMLTSVIGANSIDTLLAYGILMASIASVLFTTPKSRLMYYFKWMFMLAAFVLGACFISKVFYSVNTSVLKRIQTTYFQTVFWGGFCVSLLDKPALIKKAFRLIGYIVFLMLVYEPFSSSSTLFTAVDNSWGTSGYLTWGYRMLIGVILLTYSAFNTRKKIDIVVAIISIIELALIGNRGATVAVILFISLYVLLCTDANKKIKYCTSFGAVGLISINLFNTNNILALESLLTRLGIRSRNLTKLLNSTLIDSGRDEGYSIAINKISSGNFLGLGVGGDQVLVGNYPHNIVLEALLQYGNVIGTVIILVIGFFLVKSLLLIKDRESKAIFITVASLGLIKLWFSSTYLYELWFWAFIVMLCKVQKSFKIGFGGKIVAGKW